MPDQLPLPVRTDRLLLRASTPADVETTWSFRRLPEVAEWLSELPPDLEAYRARFTAPERLATTLVVEHEGEVVGDLMLKREDAWAQKEVADDAHLVQAELGWVIDPRHAGRGFATEAARELMRLCFEDLGVRRVVAYCFADNAPSWRLMERLGMRRETYAVKESLHRGRGWVDSLGYALLAEEWHG